MLKPLADENIPKKLVILLKRRGVDATRLQNLGVRGISDRELASMANRLGRTILTRDSDFTLPSLLSLASNGVIYISYQPPKTDIPRLAESIASMALRAVDKTISRGKSYSISLTMIALSIIHCTAFQLWFWVFPEPVVRQVLYQIHGAQNVKILIINQLEQAMYPTTRFAS